MNIEEEERVDFDDLEFDSEEENIEYHAIMLGKQYKILNSKLNMILQFLNDYVGSSSSINKEDVEFLLKSQESKMKFLANNVVTNLETRLKRIWLLISSILLKFKMLLENGMNF
ncbi:unnamed protein product [Lactuca saligna]|uniref:Uncharacterized protein n=1 Tax=Lactuca saligna TaxID=75948 RepID=A0AA35Z6L4_LACSI|nr:unnamed protein product [Lactuca saligna]